ncbi:MAG: glycerol-3-phosphate acyltransferase PlsY [Alphaproteobacteria bacterium]|jgi:glycerol-3-phosphate acyltransferase PlsY
MIIALLCILSYFLGTLPSGRICAFIFKLGDLQNIGSGNTGATNVLRTGNKFAAFLTLLFDALKGSCAVLLAYFTPNFQEIAGIIFGAWAFIGHVYPVWYKFKGGKGVATYLGILFGLNIMFGIFGCILWLIGGFLSKISSVGALNMALLMPALLYFSGHGTLSIIILCALSVILIIKHKDNIKRIINKTEPKIGSKKNAA